MFTKYVLVSLQTKPTNTYLSMSDEVDTVESNSLQAVTSITAVINIVLFIWMIVNITRFDHFHLTTSEYRMETWAAVFISALGTGINMAILNFIAGGVAAAQLLFACLSWWVGWRTGRIVVRGELGEMRKPVLAEMGETGGNNRNDGAELRTLRISTSMGNHRSGQKVSSDSTVVNEVPRTSSRPPSYRAEEVV